MLKNIKLIGALLVAVCAGTSMNAACVDGSCSRSATPSRQTTTRTVRKPQPVKKTGKQAARQSAKKAGKRNAQVTQPAPRQTGPRNATNQSGKSGGCANGQCSR